MNENKSAISRVVRCFFIYPNNIVVLGSLGVRGVLILSAPGQGRSTLAVNAAAAFEGALATGRYLTFGLDQSNGRRLRRIGWRAYPADGWRRGQISHRCELCAGRARFSCPRACRGGSTPGRAPKTDQGRLLNE